MKLIYQEGLHSSFKTIHRKNNNTFLVAVKNPAKQLNFCHTYDTLEEAQERVDRGR